MLNSCIRFKFLAFSLALPPCKQARAAGRLLHIVQRDLSETILQCVSDEEDRERERERERDRERERIPACLHQLKDQEMANELVAGILRECFKLLSNTLLKTKMKACNISYRTCKYCV
jgi:hypothetical protein